MTTDKVEIFRDVEMRLAGTEFTRVDVWSWRYRRANNTVIAGAVSGYNKRAHAIRMAKAVTGWDEREVKVPILGPDGQDWSDIANAEAAEVIGVVPGRRYADLDPRRHGREVKVMAWDEVRDKWEIRAVLGDGLGPRTFVASDRLRRQFKPCAPELVVVS